ncbi:ABC transporter permease, partial [Pseudomonas syringae pv. tagetis]
CVPADDFLNAVSGETVFDAKNIKSLMYLSSPMIMVGRAGCMAFRARFWNLGLEGQKIWAPIGHKAISLFQVARELLRLPLM